jgi:transcriptional regulator with XRE-family HTH domain
LRQFAEQAGVGVGYLSQSENGERKGTVETLKKNAIALDVDIDDPTRAPGRGSVGFPLAGQRRTGIDPKRRLASSREKPQPGTVSFATSKL